MKSMTWVQQRRDMRRKKAKLHGSETYYTVMPFFGKWAVTWDSIKVDGLMIVNVAMRRHDTFNVGLFPLYWRISFKMPKEKRNVSNADKKKLDAWPVSVNISDLIHVDEYGGNTLMSSVVNQLY